ncbi:unnamed protein product, partial [marine sediment metagenome]
QKTGKIAKTCENMQKFAKNLQKSALFEQKLTHLCFQAKNEG